jgi:GNAT superfamily N-acetyltransferase
MRSAGEELTITEGTGGFEAWDQLLALILRAFAYMNGRIDPPSSALALTPEGLRAKAQSETMFLAWHGSRLAGCAFLAERADRFYLGKLAVAPEFQGHGIGGALVEACERHSSGAGKPALELQTRIELTEKHAAFARLGFRETGHTAHPGFDRPTTITMRKDLA